MILATTETIAGREIGEVLGLVQGSTIRARHIGIDIAAWLKSIVGGEIRGYVEALADSREEAISRMVREAEQRGADGVVSVRFATSQVMAGTAEMIAYGTAVKFK